MLVSGVPLDLPAQTTSDPLIVLPLTAVGSDGAIYSQLRVPLFLDEATDDVVAEDVELRGQVLGVGQGDLPVGEGATEAATGDLDKVNIFTFSQLGDESLGGVSLQPLCGLLTGVTAARLPEVGQVHELVVGEADGGVVDHEGGGAGGHGCRA